MKSLGRWVVSLLGVAVLAVPAAAAVRVDDAVVTCCDDEQAERDKERAERERERAERDKERAEKEKEKEKEGKGAERLYRRGQRALDTRDWEQAVADFAAAASEGGARVDAALYWKAYALAKLSRRDDALAALAALRGSFPGSRWLNDAKALEAEIRQASGQRPRPETEDDEDIKLMAIQALANTDPDQALPLLEKLLYGSRSRKLQERTLFVLCQSGSPRAREIVAKIARGNSNPDLQMMAIRNLGIFGGGESRQVLSDVYQSSTDVEVKKAVLNAFMLSGDRGRILAAAKGESSPELRREAIHQLGVMGAQTELWELYKNEADVEVRKAVLHALFVGGASERLIELAKVEKDATLRRTAVHNLGLLPSSRSGEALLALYKSDGDPAIRKEVLHSLFLQGNAHALVAIARAETDRELKKEAIQKLSLMNSKEATEFLLELLNK